jgi:hypothetical protein
MSSTASATTVLQHGSNSAFGARITVNILTAEGNVYRLLESLANGVLDLYNWIVLR